MTGSPEHSITFANRLSIQFGTVLTLLFCLVLATGCGQQYSAETVAPTSGGGEPPGDGGGEPPGGGGGSTSSSVVLAWESPTTNLDQSCLSNLAGYIIRYGNTAGSSTYRETLPLSSLNCENTTTVTACGTVQTCTYTVHGLPAGEWHFTATAYNSDLVSSPDSNGAAVTMN